MLLDLIDTNNYASYNIKLAQVIGLEAAAYCSQLLTIQSKAQRKNKMVGDYFRVDRKFITNQTALSTERQLAIDEDLVKLDIITKPQDLNLIKVNIEVLSALIANDSFDLQAELSSMLKASKERQKNIKAQAALSKQQAINSNLLASLNCPNVELGEALRNWIEAVNQDTTTKPLNKVAVKTFYDDINRYTRGEDLDLAIQLINIATSHYWKTAQAAIDKYEKTYRSKGRSQKVTYKDGHEEHKIDIEY